MKTLMVNEVAFVAGGEDSGSCPAAGPGGGCYTAPSSGCTTTTPNGPAIAIGIGATTSGVGATFTLTFQPTTTTCPSPAPGSGGGGNSGGGDDSYTDWLRNTPPMASAAYNPLIINVTS